MAFSDGDVAMSLEAARPGSQVDVLVGTGGAPEGVLSACAIRCMGGFMEGRLSPAGEEERALAIKLGLDLGIIGVEAMATSDEVYFAATGESSRLLPLLSSFFFLLPSSSSLSLLLLLLLLLFLLFFPLFRCVLASL